MFRPELTYEQKISRVSAAKTILKNVEKYTMGAGYGDSQRFRYNTTFPQLFLYVLIIHVTCTPLSSIIRFEDNGTISFYHKSEKEKIPNTVLAWNCMSTVNSTISRVDARLDSAKYSNLLEQHVIPLAPKTSWNMIQYVHDL